MFTTQRQPEVEGYRDGLNDVQLQRWESAALRSGLGGPNNPHVRRGRQPAARTEADRRPNDGDLELQEPTETLPKTFRRTRDLSVQCRQSPGAAGEFIMPVTEYIWDDVNDCVLEE